MTSTSFHSQSHGRLADASFRSAMAVAALSLVVTLGAILLILLFAGSQAFETFGLAFLWTDVWDPVGDKYGALAPVIGTLASAAIAIVLACPIGFGIAYFLTEICPISLRSPLGVAIELLAAIPSIVYGMWGFFVLAPLMSAVIQPWLTDAFGFVPAIGGFRLFDGAPLGVGLFTSGIVLAIMILPFIAAAARDVLKETPRILKDGGYAMGATRWEVFTGIVLPATQGSLFGAVFLGLGRALGETMAVTFVIGNANRLPDSLYAPTASIASIVANTFPEATVGSLKLAALFALGFVLFVVSFIVLAIARVFLRQSRFAV